MNSPFKLAEVTKIADIAEGLEIFKVVEALEILEKEIFSQNFT